MMQLPLKATGCLMFAIVLLCTVPSMALRGSANAKANEQQGYDKPSGAAKDETRSMAELKSQKGYFMGPYQPEEDRYAPKYAQQPSYKAKQYPQAPTDYKAGHPRYQSQYQPQESTYGSYERRSKDGYAPEHTAGAYKPKYRPSPDAYQQPHGYDAKGSYERDQSHGYSEQPAGNPYKGRGYDHAEEQYGGEQYGEKQYGGEQYGGEQHREEQYSEKHYKKQHVVPICLQRSKPLTNVTEGLFKETFRCCGPADDADICANNGTDAYNSTYPYPSKEAAYGEGSDPADFLRTLMPSPAAECMVKKLDEICPEFAGTDCFVFQLNCTLMRPAAECGCPLGDSPFLTFSTKVYDTLQDVAFCAAAGDLRLDSPAGPATGIADVLQGHIKAVTVVDGYKEVKGAVEFFAAVSDKDVLEAPYDGKTFINVGQMIIRLLQDK